MKLVKRLVCMALVCLTLMGLAIPGYAYSYNPYGSDPNIVGSYREAGKWSSWSSWTFNKLESEKINKNVFTGEPYVVEVQVKTRTCFIRKDGTVDTKYNILVGWFGRSGGYRETATQYCFRTRILYWHNTKPLPTGMQLLNYSTKQAELYNDLNTIRTLRGFISGYEWCRSQLEGEVRAAVISGIPGKVGKVISMYYDMQDVVENSKTLKKLIESI